MNVQTYELTTTTDNTLARTLLNIAQYLEQSADDLDPDLLLMPDPPTEYEFKVNDRVIFHGAFHDYDAEIVDVHPAGKYVSERYHLHVTIGKDVLTWVWAFGDQISIRLTAAAAEIDRLTEAIHQECENLPADWHKICELDDRRHVLEEAALEAGAASA